MIWSVALQMMSLEIELASHGSTHFSAHTREGEIEREAGEVDRERTLIHHTRNLVSFLVISSMS